MTPYKAVFAQDPPQIHHQLSNMNLNQQIIQWYNTSYKIGTDYLVNLRITSSRHKIAWSVEIF